MTSDEEMQKDSSPSEESDITRLKKERSTAKGAITRMMTVIEKIPQTKEYVNETKNKMDQFCVLVTRFEAVHLHYVNALTDEAANKEAQGYQEAVLSEVDEFKQSIYMWIAGEESESTENQPNTDNEATVAYGEVQNPEMTTLEAEHDRVKGLLKDTDRARCLEEETHRMKMQVQRAKYELQTQKYQNEINLQREKSACMEEQWRLMAELKNLQEEQELMETGSVGPLTNIPPKNIPGRTDGGSSMPMKDTPSSKVPPSKEANSDSSAARLSGMTVPEHSRGGNIPPVASTPHTNYRRPRVSWQPSLIASDDDETRIVKAMVSEIMNESIHQQKTIVDTLQLPQRELQTFDGNPLKYWTFLQAFRTNVGNKDVDDASKLSCLLQYCAGQARKILECTEMMPPETGYKRALEILESRYGNRFEITQRWIAKITDRQNVKGASDLRDFADELQCCQEMLNNMGHLSDLDNPFSMRIIWKKLPQFLQDRWSRRNYEIKKRQQNGKTELKDLVDFVAEAAEEATDPVFSRASFEEERRTKEVGQKTSEKMKSRSYSTNASSEVKGKCPCCNEGHYVTQCQQFKSMRIKDRRDMVMKQGRCLNCFAKGHVSRDCQRSFTCPIDGCGQKHSKFLHFPHRPQQYESRTQGNAPAGMTDHQAQQVQSSVPSSQSNYFVSAHSGKLAMPIVSARVYSSDSGTYIDTYALLDTGSNGSYCTADLCQQLGVHGNVQSMELTTLTNTRMPLKTTVVTLDVTSIDGDERYTVDATVIPDLNIDTSGLSTRLDLKKWPHLCDLPIPELGLEQVQLLIGQDSSDLLIPEEVRKGLAGEPFTMRTPLGWAVNGPVDHKGQHKLTSHFVQSHASLETDLNKMWDIEGAHTEEQGLSVNDHKTIEIWNESLQVKENHYSMDIPFKAKQPGLPDNKFMAEGRLRSLAKRLDKDENLKKRYVQEIHTMINKGYAEVVPERDMQRSDGKVWYLPHHPILNPKKPDKCRIVFDCAAQYGGSSLNDHVHQGPDLANRLVGVLLRFRQGAVAFIADIEAMYHQVHVTPKDRDALRFLWFANDDTSQQLKTLRMKAHLFGGIWSPSCANYALQKVAEEHSQMYSEEVISTVLQNFYVDDCLRSVDTVESAIELAQQVKELLAKRGFNLTKYVSSSPELLRQIPREDWGKSLKALDMDLENLPTERALGLLWNVEKDCLAFDTQAEEKPRTKRGVLSTLSTVYDPLGYLSPFILQARRVLQELCRMGKNWDDQLDSDVEESWGRWLDDLQMITQHSIPRCIKPSALPIKEAQLHHFSDASEYAYGAASYLRVMLDDDSIHVNLIMAKSRLAPLKGSTIPRLELAGALESVRLDKIMKQELQIPLKTSVYWVDSQIVLWYISSTAKRFQTYVANRVAKILDHTEPEHWRYVPTEENPGDDASRGFTAKELLESDRWMHGPSFLQHSEFKWPIQPLFKCAELESQLELKATSVACAAKQETDYTHHLLTYFSSWFKLKKAVVWFRRFQQYLQGKKSVSGQISVKEIKEAENAILRYTQTCIPQENSQLKKLNPVRSEDGLIRVGGRLVISSLGDDSVHPIILPYMHHVSELIIRHSHQLTAHASVERVLAETRERFWILKGRKCVKSIVYRCVLCKKHHGKTEIQMMANLPESRVTPYEPPFSRIGLDYFGPFLVKRARSEIKRYGCVFTCFATRAVHIEVAHSLDTDSFINALDRFMARRGEPKEIWSDNGTNFVGAQQELKRALQDWNQDKLGSHLLKKEIEWHFNPPAASHMGGVWERQVRQFERF